MRKAFVAFLALWASLALASSKGVAGARVKSEPLADPSTAPMTLKVTLPGLEGGKVPQESAFNGWGCTGTNKSLAVSWSGAPKNTQSYALIVHDPDAPTGVGFFHWLVFNIPPGTTSLDAGASQSGLPAGAVQGYTDFGSTGYGGPCPPPGPAHRYSVTVYALDVPKIDAGASVTGASLRFMLRDHTLAQGRAMGTYQRP